MTNGSVVERLLIAIHSLEEESDLRLFSDAIAEIRRLEASTESRYVQSRIKEAEKYRDRYTHMALKCDRLEGELDELRRQLLGDGE